MNMASVIAIALIIVGFLLSLQGLWLLCRATWPGRVRRAAERCRASRLTPLLVGIPITVIVLAIATAITRRGGTPGQVVGWTIAGLFLLYAGTGMSGFVTFVGERLACPTDGLRPWWPTVRGGAAVELACLFPVIGWFVLLPLLILVGVGAMTLSFFDSTPESDLRSTLAANRTHGHSPMEKLPPLEPQEARL